jgi:RHS repeat-associated protein
MFGIGNAMISTVSIFLVLMLTIGGSPVIPTNPAYNNSPASVVNPESAHSRININENPLPEQKNVSVITCQTQSKPLENQGRTRFESIIGWKLCLTPYYFHTNAICSVTAITDANGNPVERVSYDTYGMPTFTDTAGEVVSKSTIGNTLLFHGRRYDAETNLYYFRARYYDPIMGSFLQTDPMGYEDSMNLYQGFNMNPVNLSDPLGENIARHMTPEEREKYYCSVGRARAEVLLETPKSPAADMQSAALEQHIKNTYINLGLAGILEIPYVGPAFVAGYATRSVGESYINYVKQRWNNVSVMDSGSSKFLKKATAPLMAILDLVGITGAYKAVTDDSLADEERGKLLMDSYNQLGWTAIAGYYVGTKIRGQGNNITNAESGIKIKTPYGDAIQSNAEAAIAARSLVESGATLYRIGRTGKSQAAEAQFWSLEHPLSPGYAKRYGIPPENVINADFIETGVLKPGTPFVTRKAPGVGGNTGGGIEVVVTENGVILRSFNVSKEGFK